MNPLEIIISSKQTALHEAIHVLELKGKYSEFAKAVLDLAKSPKFSKITEEVTGKYTAFAKANNMEMSPADIDFEIVARISEELVRSPQKFMAEIKGNKTFLEKIHSLIKNLLDNFKSLFSSTEQAELKKAYGLLKELILEKDTEKNTQRNLSASVQFSIKDGIVHIDTDQDIFEGKSRDELGKVVKDYMKNRYRGTEVDGIYFSKRSEDEFLRSRATQNMFGKQDGSYEIKMRLSTELDNIIKTARFLRNEPAKHLKPFNKYGYDIYAVEFFFNDEYFTGEMLIAKDGERNLFYDIIKVANHIPYKTEGIATQDAKASTDSILKTKEKVNTLDKNTLKNDEKTLKPRENTPEKSNNLSKTDKIQFSIKDGIVHIDTDQDIFEGKSRDELGKVVKDYMKNRYRGTKVDGIYFSKRSEDEFLRSRSSQRMIERNNPQYEAKMRLSTELDNIIRTAKFLRNEKAKHPKSFNKDGYDIYAVMFVLNEKKFKGEMLVARNGNKKLFYDIIKVTLDSRVKTEDGATQDAKASIDSILNSNEKVNTLDKKTLENKENALKKGENTPEKSNNLSKADKIQYSLTEPQVIENENGTTIVRKDSRNLSDNEIEKIKEKFESGTNENLLDFIKNVAGGKTEQKRLKLCQVNENHVEDIKKLTGIDVSGFSFNVNLSAINHILKRHRENGAADRTMANLEDIARVEFVLNDYDCINFSNDYDPILESKNSEPSPVLFFEKRLNGVYRVVEAVVDGKWKKIELKSVYKVKKEVSHVFNAFALNPTSETPMSPPLKKSLPQNSKKVKSENTNKTQFSLNNLSNVTQNQVENYKKKLRQSAKIAIHQKVRQVKLEQREEFSRRLANFKEAERKRNFMDQVEKQLTALKNKTKGKKFFGEEKFGKLRDKILSSVKTETFDTKEGRRRGVIVGDVIAKREEWS